MKILVLESSTTSAKAMLYDTQTAESITQTEPYKANHPDSVLQSAEAVFGQTAKVGRKICEGHVPDMIALSATWHSLCLCDRQMKPVTPVYTWQYTGAEPAAKAFRAREDFARKYYEETGCIVNAAYPYFKLIHLKEEGYRPQNFLIASQASYNTYRLTGKYVETLCMASGTGFFDLRRKSYAVDLLTQAGIATDHLPELISWDQTFPLSREGAQLLGLPAGIPVVPASSDGGLNQVSAGGLRKGVMTFSAGTSSAMRVSCNEVRLSQDRSTWCYMSPKGYLSGAATSGCCNCVDWMRQKAAGNVSYRELEMDPDQTACADTPVFLPFLFGERSPGWDESKLGAFCALKPSHGLKEMYLAVQEGTLFLAYDCFRRLTAVGGQPQHIRLSGGILNSPVWAQMCADIFGHPMEAEAQGQSSMLGAAVLAMDILGIAKAEDYVPQTRLIIQPVAEHAAFYRDKFDRYLSYYRKM